MFALFRLMPRVNQKDAQGIGDVNQLLILIEMEIVYVEAEGQAAHRNGLAKAIQYCI